MLTWLPPKCYCAVPLVEPGGIEPHAAKIESQACPQDVAPLLVSGGVALFAESVAPPGRFSGHGWRVPAFSFVVHLSINSRRLAKTSLFLALLFSGNVLTMCLCSAAPNRNVT